MRIVKFFVVLCLLGTFSACGSSGDSGPQLPFQLDGSQPHPAVIAMAAKGGETWYYYFPATFNPDGTPSDPNTSFTENSPNNPATNGAQANGQLTGTIRHSEFISGSFLIEARTSTQCGDKICADMNSLPTASKKLSKPGYYALVAPRSEEVLYLVVTYTNDQGSQVSEETYVGALEGRVDHLDFDFSPEKPGDPGGGFGGPSDLTQPTGPEPDPDPIAPGPQDLSL